MSYCEVCIYQCTIRTTIFSCSSADNLSKQFGPRSGATERIVFLNDFFFFFGGGGGGRDKK